MTKLTDAVEKVEVDFNSQEEDASCPGSSDGATQTPDAQEDAEDKCILTIMRNNLDLHGCLIN